MNIYIYIYIYIYICMYVCVSVCYMFYPKLMFKFLTIHLWLFTGFLNIACT